MTTEASNAVRMILYLENQLTLMELNVSFSARQVGCQNLIMRSQRCSVTMDSGTTLTHVRKLLMVIGANGEPGPVA